MSTTLSLWPSDRPEDPLMAVFTSDAGRIDPVKSQLLEFHLVVLEVMPAHAEIAADVEEHIIQARLDAIFLESLHIVLPHSDRGSS